VSFIEADLFHWQPTEQLTLCSSPSGCRMCLPIASTAFGATSCDRHLKPGGRVLFVDSGPEDGRYERFIAHSPVPLVERELRDGSRHQVVKVLHEPTDLERRLAAVTSRHKSS